MQKCIQKKSDGMILWHSEIVKIQGQIHTFYKQINNIQSTLLSLYIYNEAGKVFILIEDISSKYFFVIDKKI